MIVRELGLVFFHVPKAAGSTIEANLVNEVPKASDAPDYDLAWGWCPDRRIWMQHATPQQLVDLGLMTRDELKSFFKFTVVRNPFSRAVSDFEFLSRDIAARGKFSQMLDRSGPFRRILTKPYEPSYRGDHLRLQVEYLTLDGAEVLDHVGRVEQIGPTFDLIEKVTGRPVDRTMVRKKGNSAFVSHYSHFYSDREVNLIQDMYEADLRCFNYQFDDRRTILTRTIRPLRRARLRSSVALSAVRTEVATRRPSVARPGPRPSGMGHA